MRKILQLVKKSLMLTAALLLLSGSISNAQIVTVAPGLNTINDAIAANPGDTLLLEKGAIYVMDESAHVLESTVIMGEEYTLDDENHPAVIQMIADPGTAGGLYMFITAAEITLKNLGFIGKYAIWRSSVCG